MCDTQGLDNVLIRLRGIFNFWTSPERKDDTAKIFQQISWLHTQVQVLVQIQAGNNFRQRQEIGDLDDDVLDQMYYLAEILDMNGE